MHDIKKAGAQRRIMASSYSEEDGGDYDAESSNVGGTGKMSWCWM